MLDELGIEESKRLKCNAHILLASDTAIDKVFRDVETVIGSSNLITKGAGHVFNSPKNSVWYLGLLAIIAKLISPSHNKESISLYTEYTNFLKRNPEGKKSFLKNKFKGFTSNRFGGLGELSAFFLTHKAEIDQFFEDIVDVNANKLVLAVYSFYTSD